MSRGAVLEGAVLRVHRAERADVLVDALAEVLRVPLADPFQLEVVAVPAQGSSAG